MTKIDLSQKSEDTADEISRLRSFLDKAKMICESQAEGFADTYGKAINLFGALASGIGDNEKEVRQHLSTMLRRNFTALFSNLRREIDFEKVRLARRQRSPD
jgi:hypothetical protein